MTRHGRRREVFSIDGNPVLQKVKNELQKIFVF